jgi:geranylgeranylglycerol-phosphate geranylgeranyltransferase
MIATAIKVACGLTRLDTCALVFFSIFAPVYFHSHDLYFSITHAAPVLTICMCGFVINDLSDIEKDRENHPGRPLPSNSISEIGASIFYFTLLATSLALVKIYVDLPYVYLYALLLIALINYNYVVCYIPIVKNVYVAFVGLIPIFILSSLIENDSSIRVVAPSLFLFLVGREMLMDVEDAAGDTGTLPNKIGIEQSENIAFGLKIAGSSCLCFLISGTPEAIVVLMSILLDGVFLYLWKAHIYRKPIIRAMKLQLLIGIYFLV